MEEAPPVQPLTPLNSFIIGGVILIFVGVLLIFIGVLMNVGVARGKSEGGAVIIVGPFPILIASSERMAKTLMILALVFFAVVLGLFLVFYWLARQAVT